MKTLISMIIIFSAFSATAVDDAKSLYQKFLNQRPSDISELLNERRDDLSQSAFDRSQRSVELENTIDYHLRAYRDGKVNIKDTIVSLMDPSVLKDTGYALRFIASPESVTTKITSGNEISLRYVFRGSRLVTPSFDINGSPQSPGMVYVVLPTIQNNYSLFETENKLVSLQLLRVLAEELYHGVQAMRNGNKNKWSKGNEATLSEFFKRGYPGKLADGTPLSNDSFSLELRWEADVYAKLIENLGIENMPEWIGTNYPERAWVDEKRSSVIRAPGLD